MLTELYGIIRLDRAAVTSNSEQRISGRKFINECNYLFNDFNLSAK